GAPDQAESPSVDQGHEADHEHDGANHAHDEADHEHAAVEETKTAAADGDWGTLTGRIVFDGKAPAPAPIDTAKDPACKAKLETEHLVVGPDGGLANAVIMLRTKNVKVHPD